LTCIKLIELIDLVTERMSSQKKAMKETKRVLDAEAKVLAKAQAKADKEAAKAQLKLDRAAERARIKEDAKHAREEAKHAKLSKISVLDSATQRVESDYEAGTMVVRKFNIPEEE